MNNESKVIHLANVQKKIRSEDVAEKMLCAVLGFDERLKNKPELTAAEKRHQLRLRTLDSLKANR